MGGISANTFLEANEPSFLNWLKAFLMNLPMALLYQLLICGPVVRFLFRHIFPNEEEQAKN